MLSNDVNLSEISLKRVVHTHLKTSYLEKHEKSVQKEKEEETPSIPTVD